MKTHDLEIPWKTLVEMLESRAFDQGGRKALSFLAEDGREAVALNYSELDRRSRAIAATLQENGAAGERALILYAPGMDYVCTLLGCMYAGVIAVPVYPPDPSRLNRTLPRIHAILRDAGAKFVLTSGVILGLSDLFTEHAPDLKAIRWLATDAISIEKSGEWQRPILSEDSIAFLQYTSGSTGHPKGVILTHSNLLANSELIHRHCGTTTKNVGVVWIPPYHDMGLIGGILQPLYAGYPQALFSPLDFLKRPLLWLEAMTKYRATTSAAPNFAYELCVKRITPEQRKHLDLSAWEIACNGAEPIRSETLRRFSEYFAPCGFRAETMLPCYGLAEATLLVSGGPKLRSRRTLRVDQAALESRTVVENQDPEKKSAILVSSGSCGDQQEVAIVDIETSTQVPSGKIGEIWISGPCVAKGYWNREAESAETFGARLAGGEGPFLRTGDLGFALDGELYVTGRIKDLIVIRGANKYPQDIEATAEASHPALRSGCSAAVSVEIDGEEKLVVFCELERRYRKSQEHFDIQRRRDGENPDVVETSIDEKPDPRRILGLIHESISRNHEVQAHDVVLLKPRSIPKTSSGKIQRHACRAEYLEGELDIIDQWLKPATGKRADSAVNDDGKGPPQIVEAWLLSRIREKLSLEQDIDTRASLASYGIDSLSALEFAQDIEAKFSVEVPIGLLFESRSIAEVLVSIEALIRSRDGATGPIPLDLAAQVLLDPEINVHPTNLRTPAEANSIFLTGATGFLGAYLLKELMEKTEARIFCLVRAENATAGFQRLRENLSFYSLWRDSWESRIVAVPGHLSSPRLGLSEADFTALAGEIDVIYHNGALVNFIYSYQDLQAANVSGTREILRLACLAKTKPVHYVSTLSVFRPDGDPQGRAFEESDALENGSGLLNGYAESKWVAEKTLALARERGLPISIYRVGEVVGDGGGGLMKSSQDANSLLLKGCVDMGCAPRLSFQWYYVPVDYATGAIVHLSMKPASSGKNFHITNPERISSSQVFRSLSALGYEVEEIPYSAWMERVSDFLKKTPRHPLAALMPFLKKPAVRNLGEAQGNLKIDCQATVMAIDDPGIQCPKPEALLGQFLTQLVANGFLGKPTGTRGRIEIVAPSVSGSDPIFEPLRFRNLTIKNRIVRSSISGRIDNYDGSGTQARVNWEERFARGGVGAIISAHVPVQLRGRILPNYAFIDRDDTIPFWREVGEAVHRHDCKFIMQLAHSGRQQDVAGVENRGHMSLSSSSGVDTFHGLESRAMTQREIHDVIGYFAAAARRAREAGLDGIELHAANGYLFTQFMSSAINKRKDEWGGSLENRARFLLEVVKAIRAEVGRDFHLQAKISAVDHSNALMFWEKKGNTLEESVEICRWLEAAGVDAIHVSTGNMFPHPRNPAGPLPQREAADYYPIMLKSGKHTFRNYLFFKFKPLYAMFNYLWSRTIPKQIEGLNLADSRAIKQAVGIPVLCTGGFQTASLIRNAIRGQGCDAVTIARPLMANVDLPKIFAAGRDKPEKPCTYCNKCLANVLENPLGCYEVSRFGGDQERMMEELMSFYKANPEQTEAVPEELEKVAGSRTLA